MKNYILVVFILSVFIHLKADNVFEFDEAKDTFPQLFVDAPPELERDLFTLLKNEYLDWHSFARAKKSIANLKTQKLIGFAQRTFEDFLSKLSHDKEVLSGFIIKVIVAKLVTEFDIDTFNKSGYYFVRDYQRYKGKREKASFKDFVNAKDSTSKLLLKEKLVGAYKLHLMPKLSDFYLVTKKFLTELRSNSELQNLINDFKIIDSVSDSEILKNSTKIFPRVVIYPASGKQNSEKLLKILIRLFERVQGLNVAPRFNKQITSLLFYAQGDADDKLDLLENKYPIKPYDIFEYPDMALYKKDFTGIQRNYTLQS